MCVYRVVLINILVLQLGPPNKNSWLRPCLQAYYNHISGIYGDQFPSFPPFIFNFTAEDLPSALETPKRGTVAQK